MVEDPKKLDFIDALRGLAILGVILVHAGAQVAPGSPWLQTLVAGGARGVQLFYIASAFTLCRSWSLRSGREQSPLRNFYLRRVFRIAPMFYVAIAYYTLRYGLAPRYFAPNGIEWFYVPLTALFLNGFHPETITSVVPGGWSIVVEVTFYLVLPSLVARFRSLASLAALVAISIVVARLSSRAFLRMFLPSYPAEQAYLVHDFAFLNFFNQFPVFAIGMLTYWISTRPAAHQRTLRVGLPLFAAWLVLWPLITGAGMFRMVTLHVPLGAGFGLIALALARTPTRVLVNPITTSMGMLSFSMYVTHFAVLDAFAVTGFSRAFGSGNLPALLHYACVVAATAAVSLVFYRAVERPGMAAGRRLIERFEAAAQLRTAGTGA